VRLGVDDFVGSLIEHPRITFLKSAGQKVEKGEPLLLLEEDEHRLTVRSPLAGEVLCINSELGKSPERMRQMLFSEGWAYTIRPRSLQDLRDMFLGSETRPWMFGELRKLREILTGTGLGEPAAVHIQDGGAPAASALRQLDAGKWQQLEDEFLQVR
jgi:glycine cleavage system H lipoate-binding protein